MPQMMPIYWFLICLLVNLFVHFFFSFYYHNFFFLSYKEKVNSGSFEVSFLEK